MPSLWVLFVNGPSLSLLSPLPLSLSLSSLSLSLSILSLPSLGLPLSLHFALSFPGVCPQTLSYSVPTPYLILSMISILFCFIILFVLPPFRWKHFEHQVQVCCLSELFCLLVSVCLC